MLQTIFKQHKAFIPFIMAGAPSLQSTEESLRILASSHADIIELGVPFSDPVADGVVNQKAASMALEQGVILSKIFTLIKTMRKDGFDTPIILFSYFNPVLSYGLEAFVRDASAANIQGILLVDLPPEEGESFYTLCRQHHLECVLLVSPTTSSSRMSLIKSLQPAFIYYISRCAVTGIQAHLPEHLSQAVHTIKQQFDTIPVVVGFGIATPEQASKVAYIADGVVVGSALMQTLMQDGLLAFKADVEAFIDSVHGIEGIYDDQ